MTLRAITTFCWLPPLSAPIGASRAGRLETQAACPIPPRRRLRAPERGSRGATARRGMRQRHVLLDVHRWNQPRGLAILGHHGNAARDPLAHLQARKLASLEEHAAARVVVYAQHGLQHFCPARAHEAVETREFRPRQTSKLTPWRPVRPGAAGSWRCLDSENALVPTRRLCGAGAAGNSRPVIR